MSCAIAFLGEDITRLLTPLGGYWGLVRTVVEIFILFVISYAAIRLLQGTRGAGVLKGLALLGLLLAVLSLLLIREFHLNTLDWLISELAAVIILPLIVLFQPEIRRALVRVGENPFLSRFMRHEGSLIEHVVTAAMSLGRNRIGALIVLEKDVGLRSVTEKGTPLDAALTAELIESLFWPGNPLHDGGVVVRGNRLVAAGCLFPLTDNPSYGPDMGTRHRAGIGITEECDAVAVVVSEETGKVSVAHKGNLYRDLDEQSLTRLLKELVVASAPTG